ncbi:AarF/ABC1/UbiB kinase family protein|uniref:2-octaprenylphenol hydroxylase n=1 Tax=Dendrosporobacter quercicolus TaxID=146817 RepID=A0A1G9N9D4_9FIRM|nr:AarF/ABC1/UbiB kinase family protein [Dendrosporobacter quercicolus]NSL47266.1 AarF/ABC1/UbiB kinase family protein [Dendrosporobacter quercicolus DSM 1736]SDL82921.1 2-octaprenylphenol hydroxylase [Dendrosporobacter quercicolus]
MFGKRMRHINRYREVATALISQGFGYIVEEMGLIEKVPYYQRIRSRDANKNTGGIGERIRLVLQQLGPTYIKLGQIASTRPDLLPPAIIEQLEKLQDEVPGFSFDQVQALIQQELGADLEDIFQQFDQQPLAAASIGQVHLAVLQTGEKVAVKIQRPGIATDIATDLEILYELASLAQRRFQWAERYQIVDMVDEFAKSLSKELDYTVEARNAEKIAKQFENHPEIYIPRIYWDYSTKKILASEFIEGMKISEVEKLTCQGYNLSLIAERFANGIFHQIFIEGFFHGDPHPGNVVVLPGEVIAFLDFGMVGRLSQEMKYNLSSLVIGLMRHNSDDLIKTVLRMGIIGDQVNMLKLRDDVELLKEQYYGVPLSKISLGDAVNNFFAVAQEHKIRIPADMVLIGKSLLTVEGIVEKLDPGLSILDVAEPFGKKLLMERLNPIGIAESLWRNAADFAELFGGIPGSFKELGTVVNKGRLRLDVSIPEMEFFLRNQDRMSNRLSFSIILLAFSIIMGSVIVSLSLVGQAWLIGKIPIVEIAFGIAVMMFAWLLFAIVRSGKL